MAKEKIEWTPDLTVGVDELDEDHRRLIGYLNEFVEAASERRGFFVVDDVFSKLIDYTVFHFAREERVMEACGYPRLEEHRREHDRLRKRLIDCRDRYALSATKDLSNEIRAFLLSWLREHIMKMDVDYRSYVEGRKSALADALKN